MTRPQIHPSTKLTPPHHEHPVDIDTGIAELVLAVWARGWQTTACCKDVGEATEAERNLGRSDTDPTGNAGFIDFYRGYAWLKMPRSDAFTLLNQLADHPLFGVRVTTRWQTGSWRLHIPLIWGDDAFIPSPYVQIYFPNDQITELTRALR